MLEVKCKWVPYKWVPYKTFTPLPRSIGASRVHALGAVPLRKATVVATPTLVTIRKLREAYGHTRSKRSHEG